jgi:hypothetical protein
MSRTRSISRAFGSSGVLSAVTSAVPFFDNQKSSVAGVSNLPDVGNEVGDQVFVQATNRIYYWNGYGWYNIAVVNNSPTWDSAGPPSSSYTLDADSPQDATVITLSASDPDGLPLSYSYVTSGSMDSMATISQDSSVFTITPKTVAQVGAGVELTGSITFSASDGVNILPHVSSFTLSFIFEVDNSRYTTLLLDVVDTSDNNTIVDSSSNNETITVYGNPSAGTFSPYRHGSYTNYFDGTNSYIRFNNNELEITTEDFTIEAWINCKVGTTMYIAANAIWYQGDNRGWRLSIDTSGLISLSASQGVWNTFPNIYTSTNAITSDEWNHIAICRESGVISSYINGIKDPTTVTYSSSLNQLGDNDGSPNAAISYVGTYLADNIIRNPFLGNMADFHFKLGSAKYNSNFDVPTERLTAETGTTILLFNDGREVKDNSVNNYSFTNASVGFKPPGLYDNLEYLATDHGTSIYFDGSGDTLELQSSVANVVSVDFTAECWIYPRVLGGAIMDKDHKPNVSFPLWALTISSTGVLNNFIGSGNGTSSSQLISTAAGVIKLNTWHHIVVTKSGSTLTTYVDGVQESSATITANLIDGGKPFYIGSRSKTDQWFNGYIADLRFVKGSVLYTSNFTPPTAPYTTSTGLDLHLKGTEASIIDKSQTNNLQLVGNTTGSTTQTKFANTKSMYFDGTGDYVIINDTNIANFGTSDFTIETWVYCEDTNTNQIIETRPSNTNGSYISAGIQAGSGIFFYTNNAYAHTGTRIGTINTGQWHHVAWVRYNGTITSYIDGVSVGSASNTTNVISSNTYIGWNAFAGDNTGSVYIQDFRVTRNIARYTANFTPPTAPFKG